MKIKKYLPIFFFSFSLLSAQNADYTDPSFNIGLKACFNPSGITLKSSGISGLDDGCISLCATTGNPDRFAASVHSYLPGRSNSLKMIWRKRPGIASGASSD